MLKKIKQCLKYLWYSKEFDEIMKNDDMESEYKNFDFHVCRIFYDISQNVISDKKQCEYFVNKTKYNLSNAD